MTTPINLRNVDAVLAVDFSGSMRKTDAGANKNLQRLKAVQETAGAIADELVAYDDDGITIVKFAGLVTVKDNCKGSQALETFFLESRPMGGTNTDGALREILAKFQPGPGKKPVFIAIFTDGAPDDPKATAQVIVDLTQRLTDRSQCGILFVQVGEEPDAAEYLSKLDSQLTSAGAKHDVVAVCKLADLEKLSTQEIIALAFTR